MKSYMNNLKMLEQEAKLTENFNNKLLLLNKKRKEFSNKNDNNNYKSIMVRELRQLLDRSEKMELDLVNYYKDTNIKLYDEYKNNILRAEIYAKNIYSQITLLKNLKNKNIGNNAISKLFYEINDFFTVNSNNLQLEYNRLSTDCYNCDTDIEVNENYSTISNTTQNKLLKYILLPDDPSSDNYILTTKIDISDDERNILNKLNNDILIKYNSYIEKLLLKNNLELEEIKISKKILLEDIKNPNFNKEIFKIFSHLKNILKDKPLEYTYKMVLFLFKKIKRDDLLSYNYTHEKLLFLKNKKETIISVFNKQIKLVKQQTEGYIIEIISNYKQSLINLLSKEELSVKRKILKYKFKEQQALFNIKQAEIEAIKTKEIEKRNEEEGKLNEKYLNHVHKTKIQALNYKQSKAQKNKKNKILKEKEVIESKNKLKQDIIAKEKQVRIRNNNAIQNKFEKIKKIENKRMKDIENNKRIWEIVEGYKERPIIPSDFERVKKNTKNFDNKLAPGPKKPGFADNCKGFKDDYLFKDFRFKLQTCLFENNLINNEYANKLLAGLAVNHNN